MMKRISALLLALIMIFTLTACGKDKDPVKNDEPSAFELIDSATKKTEKLDCAEMDMTMNMSMDMMGMSMDVPMSYKIKGVDLQSKSPKMEMDITMSMFGMTIDMDAYVEDGYYYMTVMGENAKYKAEDAADYDGMSQAQSMFGDFTPELMKDTKIIKNADGTKTVKLSLDSDAFKRTFKDLIDSTGSSAAEGATIKDVTITNGNVEVTVTADGYIDTYKVVFDMSMTMDVLGESYTASIKVDATVQYKNPGKSVTVTAPVGYKDYPLVSEE